RLVLAADFMRMHLSAAAEEKS
ncbi:MAG: hypothetical protein RLZZ502_1370, partial [Pseudomonadota bacterium]